MPKDNKKDIDDVPAEVREDIKFILVETVDEVLKAALKPKLVKHKVAVSD
ncbi:MAG: S16 family serine protease [Dehalococcoidia bacterium]|nr:S16 family serine protease [Dehalococcoidia bacterium]